MHSPKECCFDHERLEVYQESIAFIAWLSALLDGTVRIGEVKDQLDRASTSIPLNIAEGNGKYAPKDRCRFFDIAHGSATRMRRWSEHFGRQGEARAVYIRIAHMQPTTADSRVADHRCFPQPRSGVSS